MLNNKFAFTCAIVLTGFALAACAADKKPALKGDRISVLQFQDNSAVDADAQATAIQLSEEKGNTAWPQPGANASHTPQNVALNPGQLKKIWSVNIGEGSKKDSKLISVPVAAEGMIFASDTEGNVGAYTVEKGKRVWHVNILPKDDQSVSVSSGLSYSNGVLYASNGIGQILALNAKDGKKIWTQTLEQPVRGAPTIKDGRLYVISLNDETIAMNIADGAILWRHTGVLENAGLLGAPSPAVEGSGVITVYSSGDVVALRAETGQEAWSDNLTGASEFQSRAVTQLAGFRGHPVLDQDVVIVGNASTRIIAVHVPSGERIWQKEFGIMGMPWVSGNVIFAITTQNDLVALLKENGQIRWSMPLPRFEDAKDKEDPIFWNGPVLAGGRLLLTGSTEQLLEVDPMTGKLIRKTKLSDSMMLSPIVVQKTFIVLADDGTMVAYR